MRRNGIIAWSAPKELSLALTGASSVLSRDLQFIRLNGTIVGGLVRLVLHFLPQTFLS